MRPFSASVIALRMFCSLSPSSEPNSVPTSSRKERQLPEPREHLGRQALTPFRGDTDQCDSAGKGQPGPRGPPRE